MTEYHDFRFTASFELFLVDKKLLLCCLRLSLLKRDTASTGGTKTLLQTLSYKIGSALAYTCYIKASCVFEHSSLHRKF